MVKRSRWADLCALDCLDSLAFIFVSSILDRIHDEGYGDLIDRCRGDITWRRGIWSTYLNKKMTGKGKRYCTTVGAGSSSSAEWAKAKPKLVAELEKLRAEQVQQEELEVRQKAEQLKRVEVERQQKHIAAVNSRLLEAAAPFDILRLPDPMNRADMSMFRDFVTKDVDDFAAFLTPEWPPLAGFLPVDLSTLQSALQEWKSALERPFLAALSDFRNCNLQDDPQAGWTALHLATSVFRFISHVTQSGIDATMTRPYFPFVEEFTDGVWELDISSLRNIERVLAVCGLDPETTTWMDMEQLDARFACRTCLPGNYQAYYSGIPVMNWWRMVSRLPQLMIAYSCARLQVRHLQYAHDGVYADVAPVSATIAGIVRAHDPLVPMPSYRCMICFAQKGFQRSVYVADLDELQSHFAVQQYVRASRNFVWRADCLSSPSQYAFHTQANYVVKTHMPSRLAPVRYSGGAVSLVETGWLSDVADMCQSKAYAALPDCFEPLCTSFNAGSLFGQYEGLCLFADTTQQWPDEELRSEGTAPPTYDTRE